MHLTPEEQTDIQMARRQGRPESARHFIKSHRENCVFASWIIKKKIFDQGKGDHPGPHPKLDNGEPMFCESCEEDYRILDSDSYRKFQADWEFQFNNIRNYKYWRLLHPKTIPTTMYFSNTQLYSGSASECVVRKWRQKFIDGGYEEAGQHPSFEDGTPVFCHQCDWDDEYGSGIWKIGDGS